MRKHTLVDEKLQRPSIRQKQVIAGHFTWGKQATDYMFGVLLILEMLHSNKSGSNDVEKRRSVFFGSYLGRCGIFGHYNSSWEGGGQVRGDIPVSHTTGKIFRTH